MSADRIKKSKFYSAKKENTPKEVSSKPNNKLSKPGNLPAKSIDFRFSSPVASNSSCIQTPKSKILDSDDSFRSEDSNDLLASKLDTVNRAILNLSDLVKSKFAETEAVLAQTRLKMEELNNKLQLLSEKVEEKLDDEKAQIIPKDLKRKIRCRYGLLEDDEQWNLDLNFTSTINQSLTQQFVSDAMPSLHKKYTESQVMGACRTYFHTISKESRLLANNPEKFDECRNNKKMRSRRNRLLNARQSFLNGEEEIGLWKDVSQEHMSDEEDGDRNTLKVKTPVWRTLELTTLIRLLDSRRESDRVSGAKQGIKLKRVIADSPMKRKPSKKLRSFIVEGESEEEEESESDENNE